MVDWRRWIGLPHSFGADPRGGGGADCLVMTWVVLDSANVHHPPLDPRWLDLAREGCWEQLRALWRQGTKPLKAPEEHAVFMESSGVGVVVDNGNLLVHHRRGVCWVPHRALKSVQYCRFK